MTATGDGFPLNCEAAAEVAVEEPLVGATLDSVVTAPPIVAGDARGAPTEAAPYA